MEYQGTFSHFGSRVDIQKSNIKQVKVLEVYKTQGLIVNPCSAFYKNLQKLYS
jgi:hypothetical protein